MKARTGLWILVAVLALSPVLVLRAAPPAPAGKAVKPPAPATLEAALELAARKQYREALAVCDAVIAKKGVHVREALELKIQVCERAGWWAEALIHYERLLKMATNTPARNEIRAAMARIQAIELNDPAGLAALRKLGGERLDKALLGRVRYWLAGALMQQGHIEEARAEWARYLADFPERPEIESAKGFLAKCDALLQAKADRARKHQEALAARQKAESAAQSAVKPPSRTAAMLTEADALRGRGLYKEAERLYTAIRFQGFSPELGPATFGGAECRYAVNDVPGAIEGWEAVLKLPERSGATVLRAVCLLNLGQAWLDDRADPAKAVSRFEELVRLHPDSPHAQRGAVGWALALLHLGRAQEAESILLAARERRASPPEGPRDTLERLLRVCRGEGGAPPALAARGVDAEIGRWLRLAELRFAAYDYKQARESYEKVVRLAGPTPTGGYALMQTGRCRLQSGEPDKALAEYRKFLEKPYADNPYADDALVRAGVIAVSYKNDARAGAAYFRYVVDHLQGGDLTPLAHLRLGTVLMWQRDWKGARELHLDFIRRYPQSPCVPYIQHVRLREIEKALAIIPKKK